MLCLCSTHFNLCSVRCPERNSIAIPTSKADLLHAITPEWYIKLPQLQHMLAKKGFAMSFESKYIVVEKEYIDLKTIAEWSDRVRFLKPISVKQYLKVDPESGRLVSCYRDRNDVPCGPDADIELSVVVTTDRRVEGWHRHVFARGPEPTQSWYICLGNGGNIFRHQTEPLNRDNLKSIVADITQNFTIVTSVISLYEELENDDGEEEYADEDEEYDPEDGYDNEADLSDDYTWDIYTYAPSRAKS